jgi:hypothetical protein
MEPIFDRDGRTLGWLHGDVIYVLRARAFVSNNSIVTYRARHLGRLHKGFFRDSYGDAVALMRGASGGQSLQCQRLPQSLRCRLYHLSLPYHLCRGAG